MAVDYTDHGFDPESGLTLKQRLFVDLYMVHLNATRAYRDAGYSASTYNAAKVSASQLMDLPNLRDYLRKRMRERASRLAISSDRVLLELAVCAYARLSDFRINQETGDLEVRPGVPQEALGAVRSLKTVMTVTSKQGEDGKDRSEKAWKGEVGLFDKLKAGELLCKHLGLVAAELPPLEVLLNRLPPNVANILRQLLAGPPSAYENVNGIEELGPEGAPE